MSSSSGAWGAGLIDQSLIAIAGLAVGAFAGLSASPVVAALVASLVGGLTSIALVLKQGEAMRHQRRGRLVAAAVLSSTCFLGACIGMTIRGVEWHPPSRDEVIATWAELGVPRDKIVSALFDQALAQSSAGPQGTSPTPNMLRQPVLLATAVDELAALRGRSHDDLRQAMKRSTLEPLRSLEAKVRDDAALHDIAALLLLML